jgi:hypothetical protein
MATRRNLKPTNTIETMKTNITCIALALAGIVTASAQEGPAEGQRRGPGGPGGAGGRQLPPAVLKEFDKDGDGKLNDEEAQAARTAMQAKREEAQKKILAEFDADKDGKLNEEERKAMRTAMEAKRKALIEKYDADDDGKLSPEEIKTARDAGEELPMLGGPGGPGGRRGPGAPGGEGRPRGGDRPGRPAAPAAE